MGKTKPTDLIAVAIMLILCLSWAFQQITVKYALPELGPLAQGAIRTTGAVLLVSLFMLARAKSTPWMAGVKTPGVVAGLLFGVEFILLFVALVYTDASRAVMFLYTAPFVVAIGSHFLVTGEKLDAKSSLGILIAFAGVVISLSPSFEPSLELEADMWKGDLMALGAGIGWGLTTLVIKTTRLRECPAAQVLWYQLAVSALMFVAVGAMTGDTPSLSISNTTIAAMLYQTVWVATITFGIWFVLIRIYSATSLSVITFVTPLLGALMGYLFLGEQLAARHVFAVFAVAGGILLVSLPRNRREAAGHVHGD